MSEDATGQQLKRIVIRYGKAILDEPRRLEGLLRDYCPGDKRGVALLLSALQENIPRDLLAAETTLPLEIIAGRLMQRMVENRGLSEDAAGWCIEAWAFALGLSLPQKNKADSLPIMAASPFANTADSVPSKSRIPVPVARPVISKPPTGRVVHDSSRIYLITGAAGGLALIIFLGWILINRLPINKPSPEAINYYQQGEAARLQGNYSNAVGLYDKAIVIYAGFRGAYLGRGKTLLAMGEKDKALADFDKVVELDPKDVSGYYERGLFYARYKDDQKALTDFDKSIELKPDWADPFYQRAMILDDRSAWDEALQDYGKALELNYQPAIDIYLRRGMVFSNQGDQPSAIKEYHKVIELDPRNARAYDLRGMARADLLDLSGAIEDLNRSIELNPYDEGVYYRRGLVYDRMGEDENAIEDYSKAIEIKPTNPGIFYKRGILLNRLGKFDDAINDLTTVIHLGNDQRMVYDAYLARGYIHARKGDLERAVYDAGKTTELEPQNAESWNSLCWLGSLAGKAGEVLSSCEMAVSMAPTNGNYRDSRGLARAMNGDYGGAIEDFKAFLVWQDVRAGPQDDNNLRRSWIASLETGQNPFTDALIKDLLRQETVLSSGDGSDQATSGDGNIPEQRPHCQEIGKTWKSPVDGADLKCIPGGEFLMGSKAIDAFAYPNEVPQHTVFLDAFWMDVHEVTNDMYAQCVKTGSCIEPIERISQYREAEHSKEPVVVAWEQARSYCIWAGRRLPTEAEWEKAAHGLETPIYPWGDLIDCKRANYAGCVGEPVPVGSYPESASPYGMLDMAGNVWEWVSDWYSEDAYHDASHENPSGPQSGERHVLRGGAWDSYDRNLRTTFRNGNGEGSHGFRCLLPEKPSE